MSQGEAPPVQHPALAGVAEVSACLDKLLTANLWSLSDSEVGQLLDGLAAAEGRHAALKLAAVSEADGRRLGTAAATSTSGWLRQRLRIGPGAAGRMVKLAAVVRSSCSATGAALAAGAVNAEQAEVIAQTMAGLPPVEAEVRVAAEVLLIGEAGTLDPVELGRAGRHLIETLTTEPDADARVLRQRQRRHLHFYDAYDGMTGLRGLLDPESAAVVKAALDPLAAPEPAGADGVRDQRAGGQRYADGLVQLARLTLTAGVSPARAAAPVATVTLTVDFDALCSRIGAARLGDGDTLPAAVARRLACDAKILPVMLSSRSQPLDVGRARRTIPPAIRAALTVRDIACAFPGCTRPPAWADGHHIRHWADGGPTALTNLVLLCTEHHGAVHHAGWSVALDGDGLPVFTPPPWIDPDQQPRQHHRYRLRRLADDTERAPPDQC